MQTFIEFLKEMDPGFALDEGACSECDCDPCTCDKKKDKKEKKGNPFMKKDADDKGDKKAPFEKKGNPFMKKKDKKEDKED